MRRIDMELEPNAMRKALLSIAFWTLLLSVAPPAFSHHGNAAYDLDKPLTLNGTITEFLWVNPHVQIYFDARSPSGGMQHWACETVSPGLLARAGWKKHELKAGDHIAITLAPAKSGALVGYVLEIKVSDGRDYKLGQGRDRPYP